MYIIIQLGMCEQNLYYLKAKDYRLLHRKCSIMRKSMGNQRYIICSNTIHIGIDVHVHALSGEAQKWSQKARKVWEQRLPYILTVSGVDTCVIVLKQSCKCTCTCACIFA